MAVIFVLGMTQRLLEPPEMANEGSMSRIGAADDGSVDSGYEVFGEADDDDKDDEKEDDTSVDQAYDEIVSDDGGETKENKACEHGDAAADESNDTEEGIVNDN